MVVSVSCAFTAAGGLVYCAVQSEIVGLEICTTADMHDLVHSHQQTSRKTSGKAFTVSPSALRSVIDRFHT